MSLRSIKSGCAGLAVLGLALTSCGDGASFLLPRTFLFTFDNDLEGWQVGFADYDMGASPAEQEAIDEFFELDSGHTSLPAPLDTADGALMVSGNNHSDDLFMFLKRQVGGLQALTTYRLELRAVIATNAPSGCAGIGGPPGEGVVIKGGASVIEPDRVASVPENAWRMNIDKGAQGNDGADAVVLGDFANSKDCESGDFSYELKTLSNASLPAFEVTTDEQGNAWLLLGTDSGFEGTTAIFYTEIEATFL